MVELARSRIGLIITGYVFVSREGQAVPFQLGAHRDDLAPHLEEMTAAVHDADGKIVMQIAHGGLFSNQQLTGQEPMGLSVLVTEGGATGKEMTLQEIQGVVSAFGESAAKARKAGFDGVHIHAGHGYLLNQFLSSFFNKRRDAYGGSVENRARIVPDIVGKVRVGRWERIFRCWSRSIRRSGIWRIPTHG